MPAFVLETVGAPAWFAKLERRAPFIAGYVEALFFTDSADPGIEGEGLPRELGVGALSPDAWRRIFRDCRHFQQRARLTLAAAYAGGEYDESQAGRDFHFTRNGHGVGFWDRRQLADGLGDRLTRIAGRFGSVDSYVGDDGRIYLG